MKGGTRRLKVIRTFISRYENILLISIAVGAGILIPNFGPYFEPLITPLVIFLVFGSLRGLHIGEIEYVSYTLLVILSVCISYVVLPVSGIHIVNLFLSDGALVGFAIFFSVPTTTGSAIIWTRFSQGDVQLATTVSLVSLLIAPVATPIILSHLVGSQAVIPVTSILIDLLIIIVGGVLLTIAIPSSTVTTRTVDASATLAILLLIYTSIAGVGFAGMENQILFTIVGVSVLLLSLGLAIIMVCEKGFQLDRSQTLPLFFTSNLKNLGIALLIAFEYNSSFITISIITYYIMQQIFGAFVADFVT